MEMTKTAIWRKAGTGLCLFLMAGFTACYGGKEVVENGVVLDDIEREEVDVATGDAVATDAVGMADTWDEDEFYTTFTGTNYYGDWDLDDDNFLNEDEYTTSFYQTWDADNDGMINETEWTTVVADYNLTGADWAAWDTDGDGFVETAEFDTGFDGLGWYTTWDTDGDGLIEAREYTDGVFTIWDEDDDNLLNDTEYVYYNTYYGI
ncbi:EF-hand domain-containing protein [Pontibacter pamirensis]|uniref:hypothetical protein n=1 Tax=Pontibacter pamirensis TaxID=2562824 RepID=UPI00138A257E|nr:hypothetical protein [Pontibacter pamirensis]